MSVNSKMKAIADEIRAKTGGTDPLTLDDMAENVEKVYEAGKKAEYDAFWDTYLSRCEKVGYQYAFAGRGWYYDTFFPTKDIILKNGASYVFQETYMLTLKQQLEKNGVKLDTSQMTNMDRLFYWAMQGDNAGHIIPPIGNDNVTSAQYCFYVATGLREIEKFTVSPTCNVDMAFFRCDALRKLTLGNVIGGNGWNFSWAPMLEHETLLHILGKLEDKSADTSGTEWKLTLGSSNMTKLTEDEKNIAYKKGWLLA